MSSPQKTYRVYCFDSRLKLVTAEEIRASSDEEAIVVAQASGFGSKCEIWLGRRLVAEFEGARREA